MTTAGHTFDSFGVCHCGRRWIDIRDCTEDACVGQEQIAHTGRLNSQELAEIKERRAAETAAIERAFGWDRPKPSVAALEAPGDVEIHVGHRLTFRGGEPVCVHCKRQHYGLYEPCSGHPEFYVAVEADEQYPVGAMGWYELGEIMHHRSKPLQQAPLVPTTLERQQRVQEWRAALTREEWK